MMYKICIAFFISLAVGPETSATAEFANLRRGLGDSNDDDCYKCSSNDPCVDGDSEYYKHCNKYKYIQCSNKHCYDMHCPETTVWDQDEEACGYGKARLGPCGECKENPCTKDNLKGKKFYHPHCVKKKKYLQCGAAAGVCFEMDCASGTKWDQDAQTCVAK